MSGEQKIIGLVEEIREEGGKRFAFGIAVKNWETDGVGVPFKEDVTDRPDIEKGSDIEVQF